MAFLVVKYDENMTVSKLSVTRFHLAHNLVRYISSVTLIFVAYKDDRWRKNTPPSSVLWGAESSRGIVTRCCVWATHLLFWLGMLGLSWNIPRHRIFLFWVRYVLINFVWFCDTLDPKESARRAKTLQMACLYETLRCRFLDGLCTSDGLVSRPLF